MSWLEAASAGLGAGLISGYLGYQGAQSTNAANAEIAAANNAWSAEQYAKRYQTQVKDLTAAGLNPMLAYNQTPGSSPTAQQVIFQNPWAAATSAYESSASAAEKHASASHHYSSAAKADAEVKQVEATVDKIKEETKNIPDQGKQIRQTVQMLADQGALYAQQGESQVTIRKYLGQVIQKLKAETSLLNIDVQSSQDLDNLGSKSRQFKTIIDLIRAIK